MDHQEIKIIILQPNSAVYNCNNNVNKCSKKSVRDLAYYVESSGEQELSAPLETSEPSLQLVAHRPKLPHR